MEGFIPHLQEVLRLEWLRSTDWGVEHAVHGHPILAHHAELEGLAGKVVLDDCMLA